jgi:hypothetical protein
MPQKKLNLLQFTAGLNREFRADLKAVSRTVIRSGNIAAIALSESSSDAVPELRRFFGHIFVRTVV